MARKLKFLGGGLKLGVADVFFNYTSTTKKENSK